MKISTKVCLFGIAFAGIIFSCGGVPKAFSAGILFTRTLMVGSSGEDVRELQRILNSDSQTRIRGTGPGSPGQETAYFGYLTQDAVIRYQEKNAAKILYPNGLTAGTGIVGPSTRAVLSVRKEAPLPVGATSYVAPNPAPIVAPFATYPVTAATSTNPNLKNRDQFLSAIDKVGREKGFSSQSLSLIKSQIIIDTSTTTDLRKKFIDIVNQRKISLDADHSFLGTIKKTLVTAFERIFMPEKAYAAGSGTPFGGALLYAFYCVCSETWIIYEQPLPPTFVVLLLYFPFSQVFLSYNIPFTEELLGFYSTGGECSIYYGYGCVTIPSEGMITPMVGSSAI